MAEEFMVVKHAGNDWASRWHEDPKLGKQHVSHSAAFTHTGKMVDCRETYPTYEEADEMVRQLNKRNPCGDYAVCPVLEEIKQ